MFSLFTFPNTTQTHTHTERERERERRNFSAGNLACLLETRTPLDQLGRILQLCLGWSSASPEQKERHVKVKQQQVD
jgi:hypothetical protein